MPTMPERGYEGTPPWRSRLIQILGGLSLLVGGIVIIASGRDYPFKLTHHWLTAPDDARVGSDESLV